MKRMIPVLGALALTAGCAYPEKDMAEASPSELPSLALDRAEPRLALMDRVLGEYFASDIPDHPTVCASVHDGRSEVALPPEQERALISRYEALAPFSRCGWIDNAWQDTETGEPAIVFTIHSFTCASAERCTGFSSYTAGQTASMSYRYSMEWDGTRWLFDRDPRHIGER